MMLFLFTIMLLTACGVANIPSSVTTTRSITLLPTTTIQLLPSNIPTTTPVPSDNADVWQRGWLLGQPCVPPCWEGIVPGQTSREAALAILANKKFIADLNGALPTNPSDERGSIGWKMVHASSKSYGEAIFDNTQTAHPIRFISLDLPGAFQLSEIIARYGPPSHILALASRDMHDSNQIYYGVKFIFIEHGFAVYRENLTLNDTLKESLYVSGVYFFEPTIDSLKYWHFAPYYKVPRTETLQLWHGFDTFAAYCQPEEPDDHDACAPPSR